MGAFSPQESQPTIILHPAGTPEFAAISAVAAPHNDISDLLSTAPSRFEPIYRRKPNREVNARARSARDCTPP
jgi:hypothetical protein